MCLIVFFCYFDVMCYVRNVGNCNCNHEDDKCDKNTAIVGWTWCPVIGWYYLGCFLRNHKGICKFSYIVRLNIQAMCLRNQCMLWYISWLLCRETTEWCCHQGTFQSLKNCRKFHYRYHYRQDAAKRQTAGIVFTHRPKIRFFAPQGDSLHRFRSNFAVPTGTWVRLALQNFMSIGADGWECGPQNIKNFHFLVKSRPAGATRLTDFQNF